jgi:hypothetical protein
MDEKASLDWGLGGIPPSEGAPFELVRSACRHAVHVARDVAIDFANRKPFGRCHASCCFQRSLLARGEWNQAGLSCEGIIHLILSFELFIRLK